MRALILCLSLFLALPALAVQPDEVLDDPALETRAREISKILRCPVCQGETWHSHPDQNSSTPGSPWTAGRR